MGVVVGEEVGEEVGGLLYGDENKRNASASIEMTCSLLDLLLGG